jgi:hypothetical protein
VDEMRRRPHSGELVTLDAANQAIHASECGDVGRAIRVAITRLPTGQGQVVCMRLLEGCSFSEIGMLIGTTEAACKMRFHRGMRALREDLRRQGIEPCTGSRTEGAQSSSHSTSKEGTGSALPLPTFSDNLSADVVT